MILFHARVIDVNCSSKRVKQYRIQVAGYRIPFDRAGPSAGRMPIAIQRVFKRPQQFVKMVLFHGLPGTFMNYEALQGCRYEHGCEYFTYLPVRKVGTVFAIYRETCRFGV